MRFVHATGHTIANIANRVYTQNKETKYTDLPVIEAIQLYYFTMQLYLQYNSNLQNIGTQGKQCTMLHYTTLNSDKD